jgi:hypothetical protein
MDYREYLEFLNESISGLPEIHQKALFNDIRKKDEWIQLTQEIKGWAVNLNDGVLLLVFEPEGEHRVYFCWDYFIDDPSQIPVDYADSFEHYGYFGLPPNFFIKTA